MSSKVVAFVGNDDAAGAVARTAVALAELMEMDVEAVHVGRVDDSTAATVTLAGLSLRTLSGDPTERIVAEMSAPGVEAGVIGTRRKPTGPTPAGHVTLGAIERVGKLLAVVPPDARVPAAGRFERVLIPLDATEAAARAMQELASRCASRDRDVVVVHVIGKDTAPSFWDQPHHAAEAWSREFMARFHDQLRPDLRLRSGEPRERILTIAVEEDVDAVALSWSQVLAPGRAEVIRRMLTSAPVPLLLVPVPIRGSATASLGGGDLRPLTDRGRGRS